MDRRHRRASPARRRLRRRHRPHRHRHARPRPAWLTRRPRLPRRHVRWRRPAAPGTARLRHRPPHRRRPRRTPTTQPATPPRPTRRGRRRHGDGQPGRPAAAPRRRHRTAIRPEGPGRVAAHLPTHRPRRLPQPALDLGKPTETVPPWPRKAVTRPRCSLRLSPAAGPAAVLPRPPHHPPRRRRPRQPGKLPPRLQLPPPCGRPPLGLAAHPQPRRHQNRRPPPTAWPPLHTHTPPTAA